jgi:hypothetical protein
MRSTKGDDISEMSSPFVDLASLIQKREELLGNPLIRPESLNPCGEWAF